MALQPITNGIFFQFVEDSTGGRFINSAASGIIISSQASDQANLPRWGKVTAVGPNVTDVRVGEFVLIEPGMWTQGFKTVDGQQLWKTDEEKVLAVSDQPTSTY
jgi:co-chaperonin GroES (HSP10)